MKMKRCTRCNKKRNFIERLFSQDKELCEEYIYDIQSEIRERREIPVKRHDDEWRSFQKFKLNGLMSASSFLSISDSKDYTYKVNADSITHRSDYFDVRTQSYIEVIAEIIRLARLEQNIRIRVFLYRHALVEARHFLGLYRNHAHDKAGLKASFRRSISTVSLASGISSISDGFFLLKLWTKLL